MRRYLHYKPKHRPKKFIYEFDLYHFCNKPIYKKVARKFGLYIGD